LVAKFALCPPNDLDRAYLELKFELLPRVLANSRQLFVCADEIQRAVESAIAADQTPGAVVLVGHRGKVVYQDAFGSRALLPKTEAMTLDTIFDIASLTKVVATASTMMKLFELGAYHLDDLVVKHLPDFQHGQSDITIRDLLTHFSGLRADVDLEPAWSGHDTGLQLAYIDKPTHPRCEQFVYSDINFVLLGALVHKLSGQSLDEFVSSTVLKPLQMRSTCFNPPSEWYSRIAPTESLSEADDQLLLRGVVHDPTSRFMGGVTGHAGLFSTANDLSVFCQMILDGGRDLFRSETIKLFTSPASPASSPDVRGLGWDIHTRFSGNRGDLFPIGTSFGHTGFTGTSIWIDPASQTYVIVLANSVHPLRRAPLTPLRAAIANIVARAVQAPTADLHLTRRSQYAIDSLTAWHQLARQYRESRLSGEESAASQERFEQVEQLLRQITAMC
jgi:CubicO group peptidase (beta-lactamase class C family)